MILSLQQPVNKARKCPCPDTNLDQLISPEKFVPVFGLSCSQRMDKILGGVAEWSIAVVLKTIGLHGPGGSNPSPSASYIFISKGLFDEK